MKNYREAIWLENGIFKSYLIPFNAEQEKRIKRANSLFYYELENGTISISDGKENQFIWNKDLGELKEIPWGDPIPEAGYRDQEGRLWFHCNPKNAVFSFCVKDGEYIKDVLVNLVSSDPIAHFLDTGSSFFILTKDNKVFFGEKKTSDFKEVDEAAITGNLFHLKDSICESFDHTEFVCMEYEHKREGETNYSLKKIWRWTPSIGMVEIKFPELPKSWSTAHSQIDKFGRLILSFYEGVYRLDADKWTELFKRSDMQRRQNTQGANFFAISYEKATDRLWYLDSEGHLWLEEHVSDRGQAPH